MKKWLLIIISYVFLLGVIVFFAKTNNSLEDKWKTAVSNLKAYDELLSDVDNKSIAYQLTADQLSNTKDSILQELNSTRKELNIKDKRLKSLQKVSTTFYKTDTLVLKDTIFKDNTLAIDTLIKDDWYKVKISLKYPSTIVVNPSFKSEKNIVVSTKKETVNPPKKFWLFRIFQKKHTVLKVEVIEKNPYMENQESRFVEIIK